MPVLEHNEKAIVLESAKHKSTSGDLVLTNKRLLFEHLTGVFSKRSYLTLDLPLEGIANVSVEGTFSRRLVVYAKKGFIGGFPARLDFFVKEPVKWQEKILSALKIKIEDAEAEKRKERVQVVLDFGSLKEYIAQGGLVLQTMKCPECGGPIKLPESGVQTICEHCKNTILAKDIFEEIRKLI